MPMYEFVCDECGKVLTDIFNYDNIVNPACCGKKTRRKFSTFTKVMDFRDGWDAGLGRNFNTARERNNFIAERNIRRMKT